MFTRLVTPIGLFGLLATGTAWAGTSIDQTRPLNADGLVSVENIKGRIVVRTWTQPQVRITGTLGEGTEKLQVEGDARALHIAVKYPEGHGWNLWSNGNRAEPSVIEVTMPRGASLDLDSVSADIDVQQVAGRRISSQTVSGNTRITASSPGDVHAESVSGDVFMRITTAKTSVETVSGDIDVQGGLTGDVSLESISGGIRLSAGRLGNLSLDTVSGDGHVKFDLNPDGVAKLEALSGDLGLDLPATASARLHVETFSGSIRSPVGTVRKEDGPGRTLDTRLGDGQARINVDTFSGDVSIDNQ